MPSAVFLDRDGVINEEVGYLHDPNDLRLIPGSADAIRALNERAIPVIVVTNQAGVARGHYSEREVGALHDALQKMLGEYGAHIDRFYYCPHHPDVEGKYRKVCDCRKPMPGMLHLAAKEMHVDLRHCVIIGDKASDIGAGVAAGCRTILVLSGHGEEHLASWNETFKPGSVARDLSDAVKRILLSPDDAPVRD